MLPPKGKKRKNSGGQTIEKQYLRDPLFHIFMDTQIREKTNMWLLYLTKVKFYSVWLITVLWKARPSCIAGRSAYCLSHIKAGRAGDKQPNKLLQSTHTLIDNVIDASRDLV